MNKVSILIDGASDLSKKLIQEYNLSVIPFRIIFDEEVYYSWGTDNSTISREEFYKRLAKCRKDELPSTSVPSPGDFMKGFNEALEKADSVIAILLTGGMSGTVQSAQRLVKAQFPDKDITVFDSKQVMGGIAIQILHAAKMAQEGKSKEEILKQLKLMNNKVRTIMVFQNLEYLYLQGRIGRAKKFMASTFNINPVLYIDDGIFDGIGTLNKGKITKQMKKYGKLILEKAETEDISFWHTQNHETAQEIYETMAEANTNGKTIHFQEASSLAGVFAGPKLLSISYIGAWDKNWLLK